MERLEKADPAALKEAWLWLVGFKSGYIPGYHQAKGLVPQGVWDAYDRTGSTGSYEQRQLKIAKDLIREQWRNRPVILKRTPDAKRNGNKAGKSRK